ncbi:MAG: hypothetical protein ACRC62_28670 [Microcoleus sp.]
MKNWALGIGHWALGIGHWAFLTVNFQFKTHALLFNSKLKTPKTSFQLKTQNSKHFDRLSAPLKTQNSKLKTPEQLFTNLQPLPFQFLNQL